MILVKKKKLKKKVPLRTTSTYYYLYMLTPTLFIWTTYVLIIWISSKSYENSEDSFLGIVTLIVPLVLLQLPKAFYESQIAAIDTIKDENNRLINVEDKLGKRIINLERAQLAFISLFSTFAAYVVLLLFSAIGKPSSISLCLYAISLFVVFLIINTLVYVSLKFLMNRSDKKGVKQ
ncbi:MAG TPA: hypothetical protein DEB42_00395 [Jeotgalicoccus sp.]|nr:hypothetical protein [Jeotgalicoccus sp.]